jgi:N-acetylglucosaminyldiphosphoundecaprenol N-acetyl-beta-D-mannosaminyltransferase
MTDLKRAVFGLLLDAVTMGEVLVRCDRAVQDRQRLLIGVVNAAKVVKLRRDDVLRDSLLDCDLLLADGQAVVWASRLLGQPLPERVAGVDLFERLLERAAQDRRSVYLLGARPEVLATLRQRVRDRFPGLTIAGSHDGYFSDADASAVAADIAASGADMLFLGMTSPKKEVFLSTYGDVLGAPVLHGVGGSFDILAGMTKRAPVRWQRLGLEWLYRLLQEPRRMWRRYLTTNTAFIWLTLKERVRPSPVYQRSLQPG